MKNKYRVFEKTIVSRKKNYILYDIPAHVKYRKNFINTAY